jgi:hypothetical protein
MADYDQKTVYEACATVAAALPDAERQIFADLLTRITPDHNRAFPAPAPIVAKGAHRWLSDAGWLAVE